MNLHKERDEGPETQRKHSGSPFMTSDDPSDERKRALSDF